VTRTRRRGAAAALALLVISSCAGTCTQQQGQGALEHTARLALDATRLAVEPLQDAIIDGCIAAEQLQLSRAKSGEITTDQAREELKPIRARCDAGRSLIEQVISTHDAVADRLEAGDIAAADQKLVELQERFRSLRTWRSQ
jgi:hypothetical protein